MFYLTLRKRKLSPSGRLLKNSGHVQAIARNIGLCPGAPNGHVVRCWGLSGLQTRWARRLQVYVPNGAVFQQSPRERRIRECGGQTGRLERGEDHYRLMESAVAGRSDLIREDKGRPMCRRRGEHEHLRVS